MAAPGQFIRGFPVTRRLDMPHGPKKQNSLFLYYIFLHEQHSLYYSAGKNHSIFFFFFSFNDFSLLADDDDDVDISFDYFFLGVHSSNFIHHLLMFSFTSLVAKDSSGYQCNQANLIAVITVFCPTFYERVVHDAVHYQILSLIHISEPTRQS